MEEELAVGHGLNGKAFHESGSSLGWEYSSIVSEAVVSLPRAEMLPKLQEEYGLERPTPFEERSVCLQLSQPPLATGSSAGSVSTSRLLAAFNPAKALEPVDDSSF